MYSCCYCRCFWCYFKSVTCTVYTYLQYTTTLFPFIHCRCSFLKAHFSSSSKRISRLDTVETMCALCYDASMCLYVITAITKTESKGKVRELFPHAFAVLTQQHMRGIERRVDEEFNDQVFFHQINYIEGAIEADSRENQKWNESYQFHELSPVQTLSFVFPLPILQSILPHSLIWSKNMEGNFPLHSSLLSLFFSPFFPPLSLAFLS